MPGDKSISHRSLMLGAVAEGRTVVHGFLASEDCLATQAAMETLGVADSPSARRAGANRRRGPRWPQSAIARARSRQLRHRDSLADGVARGPTVRLRAHGRRVAAAAPHGTCRGTAAQDGRDHRDCRGRQTAGAAARRRATARHRLPAADGERASQIGRDTRCARRDRPHHCRTRRDRAAITRNACCRRWVSRSRRPRTVRVTRSRWRGPSNCAASRSRCPATSRRLRSSWSRAASARARASRFATSA